MNSINEMSDLEIRLMRIEVRKKFFESLRKGFFNMKTFFALTLILLASKLAFSIVFSSFEHRNLLINIQKELKVQEKLKVTWAETLLEYSVLTSPNRVYEISKNKLNMVFPNSKDTEIIYEKK